VNREQRRHPEKASQSANAAFEDATEHRAGKQAAKQAQGQDDSSARAKSTGHKKKTADKWNQ
jgi:hypothetical protein